MRFSIINPLGTRLPVILAALSLICFIGSATADEIAHPAPALATPEPTLSQAAAPVAPLKGSGNGLGVHLARLVSFFGAHLPKIGHAGASEPASAPAVSAKLEPSVLTRAADPSDAHNKYRITIPARIPQQRGLGVVIAAR